MKSKIVAITLLASTTMIGYSNTSFAETCYTVEGEVKTENTSIVTQRGSIDLLLLDEYDNEAYRESGELNGMIYGGNAHGLLLSHTAAFDDGSTFTTFEDKAIITSIRKLAEDGMPCSFFIYEEITNIVQSSGFFANVNDVKIKADGYISTCDGENENEFELTGRLCVKE
jgi:hypothetical protein